MALAPLTLSVTVTVASDVASRVANGIVMYWLAPTVAPAAATVMLQPLHEKRSCALPPARFDCSARSARAGLFDTSDAPPTPIASTLLMRRQTSPLTALNEG